MALYPGRERNACALAFLPSDSMADPMRTGCSSSAAFHPLLVHLPIGMLVLLPFLEIAGTTEPASVKLPVSSCS